VKKEGEKNGGNLSKGRQFKFGGIIVREGGSERGKKIEVNPCRPSREGGGSIG